MAKWHGRESNYLLQRDWEYGILARIIPVVALVLLIILLKVYASGGIVLANPAVVIAIVVGILLVFFILVPLAAMWKKESGEFFRGRMGESEVAKMLKELPDTFTVFEGLEIGEKKGDIDFVVFGPCGLFVIEVKSIGGEIGFNGMGLTVNGRPLRGKDYIKQVHGELWALKSFLKQKTGAEVFIHPVLLFSNQYASTEFGYNPVANIYVIQKDSLFGLLHHFPEYRYPIQRDTLEQVLIKP